MDEARNTYLSTKGRNSLDIDLAPELPLMLADRRRVGQVQDNLLSNAARHSGESSPNGVNVRRQALHVVVSVSDRGRGISAEELPHLFRKYARLDDESAGTWRGRAWAWPSARGKSKLTGAGSGPRARARAWVPRSSSPCPRRRWRRTLRRQASPSSWDGRANTS